MPETENLTRPIGDMARQKAAFGKVTMTVDLTQLVLTEIPTGKQQGRCG